MTQLYFHFRCFLPLPSKEAIDQAVELLETASFADGNPHLVEQLPEAFRQDEHLLVDFSCFEFHACDDGISMTSTEGGHRAVAVFVQHMLRLHHPDRFFAFQFSAEFTNDGSEPPEEELFGGGAYVITERRIKYFTTAQWVSRNTENLGMTRVGQG